MFGVGMSNSSREMCFGAGISIYQRACRISHIFASFSETLQWLQALWWQRCLSNRSVVNFWKFFVHPILIYGLNFWLFIANRQFNWTANSQFHQNYGEHYENSDKKSVVTYQMCIKEMVTCNVIETITATSAVIQQTLSTVKIFQVRKLAITILWRSKKFVILSTYLIWNFHAVITDEVVDQGTLFDCRGRLWDKTRSHQEFFYTPHVWSWLFRFFWSSCIALTTILTIMPNTVREVNTMGFKVMPPATAEVITTLPVTTLQIRFFFFGTGGTAFYSCNGFCSNRFRDFSTYHMSLWTGLCRCRWSQKYFPGGQPLTLYKKKYRKIELQT